MKNLLLLGMEDLGGGVGINRRGVEGGFAAEEGGRGVERRALLRRLQEHLRWGVGLEV